MLYSSWRFDCNEKIQLSVVSAPDSAGSRTETVFGMVDLSIE
jgi:hypothetical protein